MGPILKQAELFRFIFVTLAVLLNWPVLSIPGPLELPLWLFGVWGLGIVLLWLASRRVARQSAADTQAAPPPRSQTDSKGHGDV